MEDIDKKRVDGDDVFCDQECLLKVQGYSTSFHLPERITPKAAQDLLSRLMAGEVVAATDIARLLKQTRNLLLKERVVRRIPATCTSIEKIMSARR